jgi:catechol 2,3-dioxygenase-like lactoylglutathione lyase family enzyme
MRRAVVSLLILLASVATGAQTPAHRYDHVHLAAADPAKAVDWYIKNLGASHGDAADRVLIGRTIFAFIKRDASPPSEGGAVDHWGFSVPNVDAKLKELEAAGGKILGAPRDVPNLFRFAFIQDPFGIKIELVQDPETPGFHHLHLRVPDPEATLKFYLDTFGGQRAKLKGQIDAVKFSNPDVWLLAQKAADAQPSAGRAIDHIGWTTLDTEAQVTALKAKGQVKISTEPRMVRHLKVALFDDPSGVRVEIVQNRMDEELRPH